MNHETFTIFILRNINEHFKVSFFVGLLLLLLIAVGFQA